VAEAKENVFLDKLRSLLTSGEFEKQDHLVERLLAEGFSPNDIASALIHQLQSGEGARNAPQTESYERPPREDRPGRYDDRGDRGNFREREDRRQRFDERRDERPRRFEDRPPRAESKFAAPIKSKTAPWKATPAPSAKTVIPPPVKSVEGGADSPLPADVPRPQERERVAEGRVRVEGKDQTSGAHGVTHPTSEVKSEAAKTYSDAEILASVKNPEPKPESKLFLKPKPAPVAPKPKASRATPPDQTRLWVSIGKEQGVTPIDFVNSVAGETGLPGKVVGTVDVRERHSFVDVTSEYANGIIAKLNRAQIKGHKVKVKVA
jgi:ATP-dependent RNA helicase DeaD